MMLSLLAAALVTVSTPLPPATPTAVAAASLLGAADAVQRKSKDDDARAALDQLKKKLRDAAITPAALMSAAEVIGALAPDDENVHVAVLDALMALARDEAATLRQRIRARATEYVQRNPASVRGHEVLATALLQQGDEEGQLRALAACGLGCRARFAEARRVWERLRCFGSAVPDGLSLRMGSDELASSVDIAFIEPIPGITATPTTPATGALCVVQLQPAGAGRVAARVVPGGLTMFLVRGIVLVSDTLGVEAGRGAIFVPAAACPSICKNPKPRPLPAGIVVEAP